MCPPSDQDPAVPDLAEAAAMPLPGSTPGPLDTVAKGNDCIETDSITQTDEAQDVLAPLPSDTKTDVTTSDIGSLATIDEQADTISPNDELVAGKNTFSKSETTESVEVGSSGHHAAPTPTAHTDVRQCSEPEPVADTVDAKEPARLDDSADLSTDPDSAAKTTPIIIVRMATGYSMYPDGAEGFTSGSTATGNDDAANSEDHKFVDPNDKDNIGNDVIKFFYTSSTRKRPSSPVASAPGCCNPRLHRDSDLYVKAKGDDGKAYVFEVVSSILEKASPKFEAMIYGSHTRGNKEEWVWELDDNPLGLKIMFCLLHNKFPRALVASKPNPNQLYKVLQVLDKYDVHLEDTNYHLFAPSWIDGFRKGLPISKLGVVESLRIAYEIGDLKTTKTMIREAAHEIGDEDGKRLQDFPIQQREVLDSMENIRTQSLKTLLNALKVPLEYLMAASNFHGNQYCKSTEGHFECNQKLLGSLMANLVQQSLFPIPEPANYKGSVAALIEKIDQMEIRGLFYPGVVMTEQKHTLCRLGEAAAVEEVKGKDGKELLPLSDNLLEYMYFACKRNGLLRKEQKEFEPYKDRVRDFDLLYRDEFKKEIWGWYDHEASEGDSAHDGSDDSGIFDVVDNSVWIERKVSA